jgi:hypothetical protein
MTQAPASKQDLRCRVATVSLLLTARRTLALPAATLGPIEVVRNSGAVNCGSGFPPPHKAGQRADLDIPDEPCRAWASASGEVTMLATHTQARYDHGPSLEDVHHDCRVVFNSSWDHDPSHFDDRTWLMSPWFPHVGATTVHALAHMEFHGWSDVPGNAACINASTGAPYLQNPEPSICWYNAVVLLRSIDGGKTFGHAFPPPHHLVATAPYQYTDGADGKANPGMGYGDMSNVFESPKDGFLYVFTNSRNSYKEMKAGHCLMRTKPAEFANPSSWRGWGGTSFDIAFVNPYLDTVVDPAKHVCSPVNISFGPHDLGWSTFHGKYIAVGSSGGIHTLPNGTRFHGLAMLYALSDDLLHWSEPGFLKRKFLVGIRA